MPEAQDEHEDPLDNIADRNIDHLSEETIDQMYRNRLTDEEKQTVAEMWKSFEGTKKYHNYTKELKSHEMASQRYMMEMDANEFMYVNRDSFEVTDAAD